MFLLRPFWCSDRKVVGEKQKKKRYTRGMASFFRLFPCFTKITKRDGNFKSRPISFGPNLSTFLES